MREAVNVLVGEGLGQGEGGGQGESLGPLVRDGGR